MACEHIFSYEEGCHKAWLNYEPKPLTGKDSLSPICGDVIFKFCPLCGEELIIVEQENKDAKPN